MWNPFAKKTSGTQVVFKLSGLHCVSCALNIDGELEDTPGVIASKTIYAKNRATVIYDPTKIDVEKLKKVISKLGYSASV